MTMQTIGYKNHYIQINADDSISVQLIRKDGGSLILKQYVKSVRAAKSIITRVVNKKLEWLL